MKKIIMTTIMVLTSLVFADTHNQNTAAEISIVLQSVAVQEVLKQEDKSNYKYFKGIKYYSSGRASFGPATYELIFETFNQEHEKKVCNVFANLNIQTKEVYIENKCL